ncbi:MAG TPA: 6-bladed beta-propeller [Candidatus Eremiobacteraceae bacterium]|nr:6-bladed beta-propeller [Candidatus Eremiobacteraceae bacterium]
MSLQHTHPKPYRWLPLVLAGLVAFGLGADPAQAQQKNKNAKGSDQIQQPKRIAFDISKIVWPNPPAVARIKFENILTGQPIDWAALENKQKPKQSWMDRLAGPQPDAQIKGVGEKVGFQLLRVYGVAADSKGHIYAADQAVGAVFIFPSAKDEPLELIKNNRDAHFGLINGLALDDNDRLFVTDSKMHHVLVFNAKHEIEASFGGDELVSPAGIALDTSNRFAYVVDTQQDQVLVFDADSYKLLRRIGTAGKKHTLTGPGDFSLPTNVALDREANVYVTDTLNNRVEIFDADGSFISEFGSAGDGPGHFARPKGIVVDCDGHIWVADEIQSRVQVFDKDGQLLIYFGQQGNFPGQFQALYGLGYDKQRNWVITSEQFPGRVQVFRYVTDAEAAAERSRRETEQSKPAPKAADSTPEKGGETSHNSVPR